MKSCTPVRHHRIFDRSTHLNSNMLLKENFSLYRLSKLVFTVNLSTQTQNHKNELWHLRKATVLIFFVLYISRRSLKLGSIIHEISFKICILISLLLILISTSSKMKENVYFFTYLSQKYYFPKLFVIPTKYITLTLCKFITISRRNCSFEWIILFLFWI